MSLVANYSSEDDVSDDEQLTTDREINPSSSVQTSNLLISQDDDEQDSSSDSEKEDSCNKQESKENKTKLPNPLRQDQLAGPGKSLEMTSIGMTVFTNRYEQAELAKSSILEKHVPMTEKHPERGARQICFKFKKGKCHMGDKCRFFHDQSNIINHALKKVDADTSSDDVGQRSFKPGHSFGMFTPEPEDDDNYMAGKKRKKKVGVSNNLVPPKQALLRLEQQRQSERPWTVNK